MEHDRMDVDRWVNDRLSSLEPPRDWRPDPFAALARLRHRELPRRHRWWLWATVSATAAAACAVLLLVSTPPACANPLGCSQAVQPPPPEPTPEPAPGTAAVAAARPAPKPHQPNFKESGSSTA